MKKILKSILPYRLRIELRRILRSIKNLFQPPYPSHKYAPESGKFTKRLIKHESKLLRIVPEQLTSLQHNKIINLKLACARMNGLLLEPNDIFSFCRIIGRTSPRLGYVNGLETHRGKLTGAPGGGLCQLANLIYWMALHLDLNILERHRHETDLFPDDERRVPFGMGATVFYNYRDLRFRNNLSQPLVFKTEVASPWLRGAVYSDQKLPYTIGLKETKHRFFQDSQGVIWRENVVVQKKSFRNGTPPQKKEIAHNMGRVKYDVPAEMVEPINSKTNNKISLQAISTIK